MTLRNSQTAPLGAVFCLLLANLPAAAQEVAEIPFWHQPAGTAGLGGGLRFGQDPYLAADNDDQRNLDLVPLYLYEGKYFFARGASGGIHVVNNDDYQLNVMARYRFQQLDPDRNEFYEGLEKRRQTLDAGVEFRMTKAWGELAVNWLTDTLDRHNGQQAQVSYRYRFETGRWSISPFITWTYQDKKLTDYYFGVSEAETRFDRPEFSSGSSQWNTFGLNTAWHFSDRVVFFVNAAFAGADSDVWDSPLVEESNMSQFFIGGTYTFGNARKPSDINDPLRRGEWAWRVNYGYQASGNIVSEIDQGDFSKSEFAATRIGGLTATRLLHDGPRVDFQGRFALHRHFESDEGNGNFFSYNAYIMAMGKGYSGWTGEEWFRWGFGFGMSYAETVPIEEQRKQASRGENKEHIDNYRESLFIRDGRIVFDIGWLGDVSGGSDWITAHLECVR